MGVVYWFGIIENGRFGNDDEYEQLIQALTKWNVNGNELLQINNVFLRMLGVGNENDRKLILNNIKKITPKPKNENKKLKSEVSKLQDANSKISNAHSAKLTELG